MKFEHKTEAEARKEILELVAEYCDTYHNQKKAFREGDRISYASRVYDHEEMVNLVDSSLEFWLTSGRGEAGRLSGRALLQPGKFRLLREPDCFYDIDVSPSWRTPC